MALSVSPDLSEKRAQAGRRGALARWGPTGSRTVRLGDLTVEQRRLVLALVEAAKAAPDPEQTPAHKKTAPDDQRPEAVTREVRRGSDERPAA